MRPRTCLLALAALALAAGAGAAPGAPSRAGAAAHAPAATPATAATRFHAMLDAQWDWQMRDQPEWATSLGDHRFDDRLTDNSPAGQQARERHQREWLAQLQRVDRAALRGEDVVSLDDAIFDAQRQVERQAIPALRTRVISAIHGAHLHLPGVIQDMPVRNEADARRVLTRLAAIPAYVARDLDWAREGKRLHWVTFRSSLSRVPAEIDGLSAMAMDKSPLYAPFARLPADIPADRAEALRAEARALITQRVLPAYAEMRRVVVDELLPASPENGALSSYPDGAEAYRLAIRDQTTVDLGAQQIHDIGLKEVARLRAGMEAIQREVGFPGTFKAFIDHLNTDPSFYYPTGEALLAGYREIGKRADPGLTHLFVTLPRTPWGIRPIPAYQGDGAAEYYDQGTADGSEPGWFNANIVAVAHRPKWEMEALLMHESVPGHHLQISRAMELDGLPMFRRTASINAYVEGWALYAEGLGRDLGLYEDPYSHYGQLRSEIWRAARLVVDTGVHALGWSRQQAIDWMEERTGIAHADVAAEVDRYIVWPAQALGYKLGQLKILALRDKARAALGDRFDIRRFHQAVLDHGALPLPVLERQIDAWIAQEQQRHG